MMRKTTTAMMIIMISTVDRDFLAMAGSTALVDIVVVMSPSSSVALTLVLVSSAPVVGTVIVIIIGVGGSVVGRGIEADAEMERVVGVGVTERMKDALVKVGRVSKEEVVTLSSIVTVVVSIPVVGIEEESVKVGTNWSVVSD